MKKNKIKFMWHKLDLSLEFLCLLCVFAIAILFSFIQVSDLDLWLHIKSGELIVQDKAVFQADPFSFTLNNKPWIDHSWLFQVIVYLVKTFGDFNGLLALQAFIVSLSLYLFLTTIYDKKRSYLLLTVLFGLIFSYISRERFTLRPDIFSLLFFSYYCFILFKKRRTKLIYTLIPAQILWANTHGYHFMGVFLAAVFLIDDIVQFRQKNKDALNKKELKRFVVLFIFLVISCLITPYTYRAIIYPLSVSLSSISKDKIFLSKIQELQPPFRVSDVHNAFSKPTYKLLAIIPFLSFFFKLRRFRVRDFFLYAAFLISWLFAIRHIIFFGFIACLLTARNINNYLFDIRDRYHKLLSDNLKFIFKAACCIGLILFIISNARNLISQRYFSFEDKIFKNMLGGVSETMYPKKAVDFILANNLPQTLFNDFNSGAYLIGRAYPKRRVFVDGRTELYGNDFLDEYQKVSSGDESVIKNIVERYKLEGFLLSFAFSDSSKDLLKYLYDNDDEWKIVYLDEAAVIFLKDVSSNKYLIDKFYIDLNKWQVQEFDYRQYGSEQIYPQPYVKRANIFGYLGLFDLKIKELSYAINIYPVSGNLYSLRGEAYFSKRQYREAYEDFRKAAMFESQNVSCLNNLGSTYLELGDVNLAIAEFKKAIKKDSRFASGYYNLAIAYSRLKNEKAALQNLKYAVQLEPNNVKYLKKVADAFSAKGDVANAMKYYQKALVLNSKDANLIVSYGICLGRLGKHKMARDEFIRAISIDQNFSNAHLNLADSYVMLGEYKIALDNLKRSLRLDRKDKNIRHKIKMLKKIMRDKRL